MPFEGNEAAFDPMVFSPGREGLRKLAYVLRHPELWGTHKWTFDLAFERTECGTAGCAIGVARIVWGNKIDYTSGTDAMADAFNLSERDSQLLFASVESFRTTTYRKPSSAVTPSDVADAIDAYLARQP